VGVAPGPWPWHHAPVRLSKTRVLLRAALLLFLAGFMVWRAVETGRTAAEPGLEPVGATTLSRIALVEWILAGLALLTAGAALLSLRQRPRVRPLHLDGTPRPGGDAPPAGPGQPPSG
jgi:hypothetical protein